MNRIRELRLSKGWTQVELAKRLDASQPEVARYENGVRELTEDWMRRFAKALGVRPSELFDVINSAEIEDDAQREAGGDFASVLGSLANMGLAPYRVIGDSVSNAGLSIDALVMVNQTEDWHLRAVPGSILLLRVPRPDGTEALILRQFLPPNLITTNRPGTNLAMSIDDPALPMHVIGIVVRE